MYAIFNSTGGVDSSTVENTSVVCNSDGNGDTVSAFGTYNLTIYANDSAGNENSTTESFTVSVSEGTSGGGGAGEEVEKIPTIALKQIAGERIYDELERAIFYARINTMCSGEEDALTLTVQDFSGQCSLRVSDIEKLQQEITEEGIVVSLNDLILFFEMFNNRELDQVYMDLSIIKLNNLFTSVLGITNPMRINPPRLDRPFIVSGSDGNITIEVIFTVNKDVKACDILSGEEFSCELFTNSSVKMILLIEDLDFFDKIFQGEMSITSESDPENTEVLRVALVPRVYNLSYTIAGVSALWIIIFLIIVLIIVSIFFVTRTKLQKELKRRFK